MSLIQMIVTETNINNYYIPNQILPFVCVFLITKTPAILLVGFVLGYIIIQPTTKSYLSINNSNKNKLIHQQQQQQELVNTNDHNDSDSVIVANNNNKEEQMNKTLLLLLEESNAMSNSIEFENLMEFPSCPTTLPTLDTHFNYVIDPDTKILDPSDMDWATICQDIILQEKKLNNSISSLSSSNSSSSSSSRSRSSSGSFSVSQTDEQSIVISNEQDNTTIVVENDIEERISPLSIDIENLLLLPTPNIKPSLSSPGQLFKSKFQKAVKKMKKSSNLMKNNELSLDQQNIRRSTFMPNNTYYNNNNNNNKRASSLPFHNPYTPKDPLFQSNFSPRPSASARVHDHFKGRLNKLFRK